MTHEEMKEALKSHLMEVTEKFFFTEEEEATQLIEKRKENVDGYLIEHKLTERETKSGTYFILVLKTRFGTLKEKQELLLG